MSNIILKELPKNGTLETANLYIKNVKVFFASVHEPIKKWQSEDREYKMTAFVDEATKDQLLDEVMVNKNFLQVGVDKTSKPPRKIKYPLSSQAEEGKTNYDLVDGLWGFNLTKPEFSKKGNKMFVNVIDKEGKPFTENVGNGSVVNVKLFGYKNRDGQLTVTLDTIQVVEHVPYEGGGSNVVVDDVFGVSYEIQTADEGEQPQQPQQQTQQPKQEFEDNFDDEYPF